MPSRVYLVRHAKAEKEPPEGERGDAARRLTPHGRALFFALARTLVPDLGVTRVLSSPFARARETAEIVAALARAPLDEEPLLASGASTGRALLELARRAGAGAALVGHNPELAEAVALAAGAEQKVRPGTVAALDLSPRGGVSLAWLEAPGEEG
ncbi:MAG TPA: histidine phosphatase family protein [Anaeromyxobacteraceae bacterium]|nr:histidine phosphatase family protein [Anaeromyxobacteraceae bacterium]